MRFALVYLVSAALAAAQALQVAVSVIPGVRFLRMENRHAVFGLGSGTYSFTGTLPVTLAP